MPHFRAEIKFPVALRFHMTLLLLVVRLKMSGPRSCSQSCHNNYIIYIRSRLSHMAIPLPESLLIPIETFGP